MAVYGGGGGGACEGALRGGSCCLRGRGMWEVVVEEAVRSGGWGRA